MIGRSSPRGMMFGFMAVLFGQLAVTAQATEVNVIYDKAYQSQTDVKAFFRARAMGTIIQATIFAKDKSAVERIADRFSFTLTRHEDLLSVHKPGPMTNLNAHAGEWVVMSCEAAHVLQKAKDIAQLTNGAFDPTIGTVTATWKVGFGGNTAFVGKPSYYDKWLTPILMPDNPRLYGGYFRLAEGDIVTTSGDMERHIDVDGQRYGHIMNGQTGKPVQNKFAYVTVIDHDGARGDALSTALWVMGDKAFDFLKAHPDIQALLVMKEGKVAYVTPSLADRTNVKSDRLTLKTIE